MKCPAQTVQAATSKRTGSIAARNVKEVATLLRNDAPAVTNIVKAETNLLDRQDSSVPQ